MQYVICTIFEGDYHYGVAALTNSLYKQGYRGEIFAGYRGALPSWTASARKNVSLVWEGSATMQVAEGLQLHFLPLKTDYHFTNYKPDFLLTVCNSLRPELKAIFYFDPDIVVSAPWTFFEDWVNCGVAVCEDVNSPIAENHPTRVYWRKFFSQHGFELTFKGPTYVNGGFVGVDKGNVHFLELWKSIQEAMGTKIGGLARSAFKAGLQLDESAQGPFAPFGKTDQDALNATLEAWPGRISLIHQEAMGFKNGLAIMPHALGQPKPWNAKMLSESFKGKAPGLAHREYWENVIGPLKPFSNSAVISRKILIKISIFITRIFKSS